MAERRRLAAIMFTDIVGYSTLAERDEALALELLDRQRSLIEDVLSVYDGRLIKSTGDGFLIEFGSALQALRAAVDIQQRVTEANEARPSDQRFKIRIGLHLGDVVERDGDVYGNGVNVAARVEPLAEPGGICISRAIHEQVRRQADVRFHSLGAQRLKNLDEPIEIYAVDPSPQQVRKRRLRRTVMTAAAAIVGLATLAFVAGVYDGFQAALMGDSPPTARSDTSSTAPASDRSLADLPSMAVLPLDNLSAEADNRYFSDGMTEEIINALAQVSGLQVISRTSVFNLADRNLAMPQIADRLNVGYVLDGSVRRAENRVRIAIQLIDVDEDTHVWSDTYERELTDVFEIQEEIARSIAEQLQVRIASNETARLSGRQTENPDAYEHYLRGRFHWSKRTEEGFQQAIEHFRQALEIDPDYAQAHAGLADAYSLMANYGYLLPDEAFPKAESAARQAIEINPELAAAHTSLAFVLNNYEPERDSDEAERRYRMALELNPNYATAHHWYSNLLEETGRSEQAFQQAKRAVQLDPLSPIILSNLAAHYATRDDVQRARELYRQALEIDPEFTTARLNLASLDAQQQDYDSAQDEVQSLVEKRPEDTQTRLNYASVLMSNWQWNEAEQQYLDALDLDASSTWKAQAHLSYSVFLGTTGQFEKSVRHIQHTQEYRTPPAMARQLELTELIWNANRLLYRQQDPQALARAMRTALDEHPDDPLQRASAYIYLAYAKIKRDTDRDSSLADLAKAEELLDALDGDVGPQAASLKMTLIGTRGLIYAQLGRTEDAEAVLDDLLQRKEQLGLPYIVAQIYFQLGRIDKGFEWLDVGYTRHDWTLGSIVWDPGFDPVRDDPRFQELLEKMNLTGQPFSSGSE